MTRRVALLILLMASAIRCSPIDGHAIKADFERTHAGCHVKALAVGEGDSDNVYVRIKYRCGKDTTLREEAWLYQRVGNEWKPKAKVPNGSIKVVEHRTAAPAWPSANGMWPPSNSAAAPDGNRCFIIAGATISRSVAAGERQTLGP